VTATQLPRHRPAKQIEASPSPSPSVWVSPPTPGDLPPEPKGPIRAARTADGVHLYALLFPCPGCLPYRLVGSDDGGRTWTTRSTTTNSDLFDFEVQATGTLATTRTATPTISTDGGRTWHPTTLDRTPVRTVPAGGWLSCYPAGGQKTSPGPLSDLRPPPCVVGVVDPATRTVHPLASAPSMTHFDQATVPSAAGLWLVGRDAQNRPSVAVSRDGGTTWSVHTVPPVEGGSPSLATYDGQTAYITIDLRGFRTGDGGRTWQPINGGAQFLDGLAQVSPSIVRPDGTHVAQPYAGNGFVKPLVSRDGGKTYLAERSPDGYGPPLEMTFGGGYLGHTWDAIYLSTDGLHWRKVTPQ
jgi:hypothetical protein